uniref:Retinol dehydrogenase 8 n=1 Tax=Apteryx owenii TaxID=8824 RepID=A0A8B9QQ23_APTOW
IPAPCTVLITGCSSGIGLAIAVRLARDPQRRFQVIATMRDLRKKEKLEEAAGPALGQTLSIQHLDVCSDSSVAECVGSIPGGRVDVLVSNAGMGHVGPVESISVEEMKHLFDTNFFGAVRMIKAVLPDMKRRRSGHIVVISSVMGLQGIVFNDVYAASKFAVEGFCESLAVQLLQFDIFISMVEPGPVNTDFERKLLEEASRRECAGADAATVRYFRDVYLPASRDIFAALGQSPEAVAEVGAEAGAGRGAMAGAPRASAEHRGSRRPWRASSGPGARLSARRPTASTRRWWPSSTPTPRGTCPCGPCTGCSSAPAASCGSA